MRSSQILWRRVNSQHLVSLDQAGLKFPHGKTRILPDLPSHSVVMLPADATQELAIHNIYISHCLLSSSTVATENALELGEAERRRTVWRMDGGAGSDDQFRWLLQREYHVIAKGLSNVRASTLANSIRRWDSYEENEQLAEVPPPIDYGRPVCIFVKRRWQDEKWKHSYDVITLQLPSKRYFIEYYHQRGGAEVEQFRQDKQGLYLAARRKSSFTGQQGYMLLTDLVQNLLADFRYCALQGIRFANYGLKRIVRDLLYILGRLYFDDQQLKQIELLKLNQNSRDLII